MSITRLPFEEVFADESGGNIKTPQSEYLREGQFPVVDQGKALIAGYVDEKERVCGGGRPAIVFGDHTRCVKYIDQPFCMGADGVKVLRPKIDADLKYLYYYLKQLQLPDAGYDRHFKYLKRTEVVLFPLPEQRRITAILDKADALRTKRREALAQLDRLAQSIFIEMFGDPATNPKQWRTVALDQLVRTGDTINYGVVQPGDALDEGIPIVRVGDVVDGNFDATALKRIDPTVEAAYKRSRLKGDEILVTCVGSVGVVAIVEPFMKGYNIARAVSRIPASDEIDRTFLASYLQTDFVQRYFTSELRTVSQPTLNIKQICETKVIQPPLSLQQSFASRVRAVEALKATHKAAVQELDRLIASLQYRAFAGEL